MLPSKKKKKSSGSDPSKDKSVKSKFQLKALYANKKIHRGVVYLLFYLVLFFVFISPFLSRTIKQYRAGERAEETVISSRNIRTVDIEATEAYKSKLMKSISPVVDIDLTQIESQIGMVNNFFNQIPQTYSAASKDRFDEFMRNQSLGSIDDETFQLLIKHKSQTMQDNTLQFITALMKNGVYLGNPFELSRNNISDINVRQIMNGSAGTEISYTKINLAQIIQYPPQVGDLIKRAGIMFPSVPVEIIHTVSIITMSILKPNLTINQVMTEQNINQILSRITPVYVTIQKGEPIIEKHKSISIESLKKLQYYRMFVSQKRLSFLNFIGVMLFLVLFTALIVLYLNHTHKEELKVFRNFVLVYFFLIANAILLHVIFKWTSEHASNMLVSLLIPIGITSICMSILINNETSMSVNFVLTFIFLIGLLLTGKENFIAIFIFLCAGGVASFSVKKIRKRTTLFRAGLLISISNFILISAYALIYQITPHLWYKSAAVGIINGIVCSIVAMGIMPFFENILKLPTPFKLMELSDLNTPVLKEMLIEAPGTYHHSLMVANLAESAAEAIHSNAMLARVGSIFHDIGKLENPRYFIENQNREENPHDKLQPSLSASIIKAHVKNGVEKAKALKLPHEVIDFVEQHHGSSVIRFFYEKARAKAAEEGEDVSAITKNDYAYEGPKPQTKETAIVMLADSVEAASKTLINPSPSRIQQMIDEIIGNRFLEGDLSDSNLTLNEIRKISFAFYQILAGVFHTRIEYPSSTSGSGKKLENSEIEKNINTEKKYKRLDDENRNQGPDTVNKDNKKPPHNGSAVNS